MACRLFEEIDLINKIRTARGDDFTLGFLAGINLTTATKPDNEEPEEKPGE